MADIYTYAPRQRSYLQLDVNNVANSLKTLREDQERAAQQRAALTGAMGQLRNMLNPAEYGYMNERTQGIGDTVNNMVSEGDYRGAINYAQQAAANLVADPGIQDRIKANTAYQEFVKGVQANGKISQDVKDWAIANNPYYYEDIKDANGNVIGGKEWKPTVRPVDTIPLAALSDMALKWVQSKKGGGTGKATFVKTDGTLTTEYSSDVEGVAWQEGGKYEILTQDMLKQALQAAIESTPGAKESFHQDYVVAKWQYDQLPDYDKSNIVGNDIIDANGRMYTEEEYLQKRIQPWLTAAQINNREYSISYGDGIARRAARIAQQQAQAAEYANALGMNTQFYGGSVPITYDNTDDYIIARGEVNDAINNITKAMPLLASKESWKNAVANDDIDTILKLVNETKMRDGNLYRSKLNEYNRNLVSKGVSALQSNKGWISETKNTVGRDNLDAVETQAAIYNGIELPANKYSKDLYRALNELNDGAGKNAATIGIRLTSQEDLNDLLSFLSLDTNGLKSDGVDIINTDKHDIELRIDKNNPNIFKYLAYVGDNRYKFDSFWRMVVPGMRPTQITTYDSNGQKLSEKSIRQPSYLPTNTNDQGVVSRANPIVDIARIVNNLNSTRQNVATTTNGGTSHTNTLAFFQIPELQDAINRYGEDSAEYGRVKKDIMEELHNAMSQANPAQGRIFTIDSNSGVLTQNLTQPDKRELWDDITAVLSDMSDNANRVTVDYGTDGVLHGYVIVVTPKDNAKGLSVLEKGKTTRVFVVADNRFLTSNRMEELKNDSKTKAIKEYNRRKIVNADYINSFGNVISPFVGNDGIEGAYVDGNLVSKERAEQLIEADILINDAATDEMLKDGIETINAVAQQPVSPERDASLNQLRSVVMQLATTAAAGVLANAGIVPPDPTNPNNPVNAEYRKTLNSYANKIIEKAQ